VHSTTTRSATFWKAVVTPDTLLPGVRHGHRLRSDRSTSGDRFKSEKRDLFGDVISGEAGH
jgi:hypothetical protein